MAGGYNDMLSNDGVYKGSVGRPELLQSDAEVRGLAESLAESIRSAQHVVVHTGAGISTSAGVADFRGPHGVWTLEKEGRKPESVAFGEAVPTFTHMALVTLFRAGMIHFVVSQNVDGLHIKSGFPRHALAELHGNVFKQSCDTCSTEYFGDVESKSVGFKGTGQACGVEGCAGRLVDCTLDWDDALPEEDLRLAEMHCKRADLSIVLGSSLQIKPACNLPVRTTRRNGKKQPGDLCIVNLQRTPKDGQASLRIFGRCDDVLAVVMQRLAMEVPPWTPAIRPHQRTFKRKRAADDSWGKKSALICPCSSSSDPPGTRWVACDICEGWVHAECVGYTRGSDFNCTSCTKKARRG